MGIINRIFGSLLGGDTRASKITMAELSTELTKLREGKREFDFFGIVADGLDCIYFVSEGNLFQIEFEAMEEGQIPYIAKLKEFADSNGFASSMTTYGNKPNYNSTEDAPVRRIETNSDVNTTVDLARKIQNTIFYNTDDTEYGVVP